jgi:hypothetical protein
VRIVLILNQPQLLAHRLGLCSGSGGVARHHQDGAWRG